MVARKTRTVVVKMMMMMIWMKTSMLTTVVAERTRPEVLQNSYLYQIKIISASVPIRTHWIIREFVYTQWKPDTYIAQL